MAKKEKEVEEVKTDLDELTADLIKNINSDHEDNIAYDLSKDDSPTNITSWISTGSKLLDYIISKRFYDGGIPAGRITEIFGPPSIGKSHLAIQVAKSAQKKGALVVYIDTENATSKENLQLLGVNLKGLAYVQPNCTEDVFKTIESTINKAKALNKDVPILVIWDSVAGTSPKAEIDGEYDQSTIGLQARTLSKGFRKITGIIGFNKVTFLCLNQTRMKIGVMFGDPTTTPGGQALPYHASVRIKLGAGDHIKEGAEKDSKVIGINVRAETIKNKVSSPFRKCEFSIHFGVGINEEEQVYDLIEGNGEELIDGNIVLIKNAGAWKKFSVIEEKTKKTIIDENFRRTDFKELMTKYLQYLNPLFEKACVKKYNSSTEISPNSLLSVEAVKLLQKEQDR